MVCVIRGTKEVRLNIYIICAEHEINISIFVDIGFACQDLASIADGIHLPGCLEFIVARSTLSPKHAPRHQHKLDPLHPAPVKLRNRVRYWVEKLLSLIACAPAASLLLLRAYLSPAAISCCPSTAPSFSVAQ